MPHRLGLLVSQLYQLPFWQRRTWKEALEVGTLKWNSRPLLHGGPCYPRLGLCRFCADVLSRPRDYINEIGQLFNLICENRLLGYRQ